MTRASGRDRAYEHLRTALLTDPSLVGTFMNESELAEVIGVSRTPVREALLLLSAEGLVQLVPNRGAFVPPLTPEQVHSILQARGVIESWAASEVVHNLRAPLNEMRALLDKQRRLPDQASPSEFIQADRDFHSALVRAAGNPFMTQMYEMLRARHVIIGVGAITNTPSARAEALGEHEAILEALSSGDEARVAHAVRSHLLRTATRHNRG